MPINPRGCGCNAQNIYANAANEVIEIKPRRQTIAGSLRQAAQRFFKNKSIDDKMIKSFCRLGSGSSGL